MNKKFIRNFTTCEIQRVIEANKSVAGFLKCTNPDCSSNERYSISDIGFDAIDLDYFADISLRKREKMSLDEEEIEEIFECPDCGEFMSVVLPYDAFAEIYEKARSYESDDEEEEDEEEDEDEDLYF
ncbi:MAG: hypothetical protein HFH68_13185 [Lachnospiraceae bacterium]|nr:hypothetical protein [Lachnospiraceae bacterium]